MYPLEERDLMNVNFFAEYGKEINKIKPEEKPLQVKIFNLRNFIFNN